MKVITYIYKDFVSIRNERGAERFFYEPNPAIPDGWHIVSTSYKFCQSCERFGYEVVNLSKSANKIPFQKLLPTIGAAFADLPPDEVTMYADGADTYFQRPISLPTDRILYMTEKAIWPPTEEHIAAWKDHPTPTPWAYVNGGGYGGPAGLLAEFYQRYGLNSPGNIGDAHSQRLQAYAYLQARKEGFPIQLDQNCRELQTIGFADPDDFGIEQGLIINRITGTCPAILHGNGRTAMQWVYDAVEQKEAQHG